MKIGLKKINLKIWYQKQEVKKERKSQDYMLDYCIYLKF